VPAAAVIPAPIAYIKVVAVKKLVVVFIGSNWRSASQTLSLTFIHSAISCIDGVWSSLIGTS
jgi:hypothetical protein